METTLSASQDWMPCVKLVDLRFKLAKANNCSLTSFLFNIHRTRHDTKSPHVAL
jgi:hypothetical protein